MSLLSLRFERSLVSYLQGELPGLAIHPGHSNGDQTALPRMIVTAASGGGDLVKGAGVDQLEVEIQLLIATGGPGVSESGSDLDPLITLAKLSDGVRGALQESALSTVASSLSADPRIAFCGMEYEGHKEGRDPERSLHGVMLSYRAWAGLLAE
jgi:hypothetical protein